MVFSVPVTVRGYELDVNGHLNQAVYLQYAEHARWELLRSCGVQEDKLMGSGIGPVVLENTIKYLRELHISDIVTVSCEFVWGGGKTYRMHQEIRKLDGTLSAEVNAVGGILDLKARKLVSDPAERLREISETPELLGL
ncbi:acyl-CoA thioesterase [Nocardia sp. NPDC006630]|uniref:acyl-CoA thioesterase n=1 Tax=Nocardia sp. NPDC006630 TaxID=3157181 RepID=UPI0033A9BD44